MVFTACDKSTALGGTDLAPEPEESPKVATHHRVDLTLSLERGGPSQNRTCAIYAYGSSNSVSV